VFASGQYSKKAHIEDFQGMAGLAQDGERTKQAVTKRRTMPQVFQSKISRSTKKNENFICHHYSNKEHLKKMIELLLHLRCSQKDKSYIRIATYCKIRY
jgi:hypothetical protein